MTCIDRTVSVAPMMDWTDRHFRYFCRLISSKTLLYTEMITTGALLHGDTARFLGYHEAEHPVALQLGGSNPEDLVRCARLAQEWGYDEINLNVGCPSDRVQNNLIGACLMGHKALVARCIEAMQQATDVPVTVKHRIGIDDQDSYEFLKEFVATVAETGCRTFIVHARKAILQGLSPKENRTIPPLIHDRVYQLKQDFPQLEIIINGGIRTTDQCLAHLQHVDGVMIGREIYQNPWLLHDIAVHVLGESPSLHTRKEVVEAFIPYVEGQLAKGVYLGHITRHILGIFHAQPGGKQFRRYLSENAHQPGADVHVLRRALEKVRE